MNIYILIFFLIKIAFSISLVDNKAQVINNTKKNCQSISCLILNTKIKNDSEYKKINVKRRFKKRKFVKDAKGSNKLSDKTLNEQITKLNKELLDRFKSKTLNEDDEDEIKKKKINNLDSNLEKVTVSYLGKKEFNKLSQMAFNSIQSLLEIELPKNPTFNEKFIDLIQMLIVELNYIKIQLKQANCKMRLSFKNQKMNSDCDKETVIQSEPCNCPKSDSVIKQNLDKLNQYNYQPKNNVKLNYKTASVNKTLPIVKLKNDDFSLNKTDNKSLKNSTFSTDSNLKNETTFSKITLSKSRSKIQSTLSLNNTKNEFLLLSETTSETNNQQEKSTRQNELSKQLRSAIDCFLCKHQWAKCFNVGLKCPA